MEVQISKKSYKDTIVIQVHKVALPNYGMRWNEQELTNWRSKQDEKLTYSPRCVHMILCDGWTQKELMKLPHRKNWVFFRNSTVEEEFDSVWKKIIDSVLGTKRHSTLDTNDLAWKLEITAIHGKWDYFKEAKSRVNMVLRKEGKVETVETEKRLFDLATQWRIEFEKKQNIESDAVVENDTWKERYRPLENRSTTLMKEMDDLTKRMKDCLKERSVEDILDHFDIDSEIVLY